MGFTQHQTRNSLNRLNNAPRGLLNSRPPPSLWPVACETKGSLSIIGTVPFSGSDEDNIWLPTDSECNNLRDCLALESDYLNKLNLWFDSDLAGARGREDPGFKLENAISDWYTARSNCTESITKQCFLGLDWTSSDYSSAVESCVAERYPDQIGFQFSYGRVV